MSNFLLNRGLLFVGVLAVLSIGAEDRPLLAPTPPMGWNSWDSYGTSVTEADVKANAEYMAAHLKAFGWTYVVVDEGWFVRKAAQEGNPKSAQYSLDESGRYVPDPDRFPSAAKGAGFKPLADYVHALGLKFGIHILRGIPKQAVEENLPIAGSTYRASAAASRADPCPWNEDNDGTDSASPAAQAYYDSIAQLYANWGVDFVKADCIASRPYKGDDIRMLSAALRKTGRPIVLSLSPGEAPVEKIAELRSYAEMWRISDDVWDLWHGEASFPQGVNDQFPRAGKWAGLSQPGKWPDADMLPLGYLGPRPGWGDKPRQTRLTHDEQRMLMTLWCMFRSPLMMGGNLPQSDDWTLSLLTNPEVLEVDQHSSDSHEAIATAEVVVWTARAAEDRKFYVAVFNRGETEQHIRYEWSKLGLSGEKYVLRDLWERKELGQSPSLDVRLKPHSSLLYSLATSN